MRADEIVNGLMPNCGPEGQRRKGDGGEMHSARRCWGDAQCEALLGAVGVNVVIAVAVAVVVMVVVVVGLVVVVVVVVIVVVAVVVVAGRRGKGNKTAKCKYCKASWAA